MKPLIQVLLIFFTFSSLQAYGKENKSNQIQEINKHIAFNHHIFIVKLMQEICGQKLGIAPNMPSKIEDLKIKFTQNLSLINPDSIVFKSIDAQHIVLEDKDTKVQYAFTCNQNGQVQIIQSADTQSCNEEPINLNKKNPLESLEKIKEQFPDLFKKALDQLSPATGECETGYYPSEADPRLCTPICAGNSVYPNNESNYYSTHATTPALVAEEAKKCKECVEPYTNKDGNKCKDKDGCEDGYEWIKSLSRCEKKCLNEFEFRDPATLSCKLKPEEYCKMCEFRKNLIMQNLTIDNLVAITKSNNIVCDQAQLIGLNNDLKKSILQELSIGEQNCRTDATTMEWYFLPCLKGLDFLATQYTNQYRCNIPSFSSPIVNSVLNFDLITGGYAIRQLWPQIKIQNGF